MVSYHLAMFGGLWSSISGDMSGYLMRDINVLDEFVKKLFMVCHHFAKFGCHSYCSSGDVLVYHMIKQNHVINGSGDSNNRSPFR